MRIVSDNCTQHLRQKDNSIREVPPGTAFDCPDDVAVEKMALGLARLPVPAVEGVPASEAGEDTGADAAVDDDIVGAILEIGRDEKPSVAEVSKLVGRTVTAAERDAAWASIQG